MKDIFFKQKRMPAEWAPHSATWIAWPHEKSDWPEKFQAIKWVYAEIVRVLIDSESINVLCHSETEMREAKRCLEMTGIKFQKPSVSEKSFSQSSIPENEHYSVHLILQANNRSWLRDSAPTCVIDSNEQLVWMRWNFNAWAKYDNYLLDQTISESFSNHSQIPLEIPIRPDQDSHLTLEGGMFDVDGEGSLLTTEECLLSSVQQRNPGLDRKGYEESFARYLGIKKVIWLGNGCAGDDTHGHVDDIARFVAPGKIVLAYADLTQDPDNHKASLDNLARLKEATDSVGRKLDISLLPMPKPIYFDGQRLPASYANFYIANKVVIVPTFNDPNDQKALLILQQAFPTKQIVGIASRDLILGLGSFHCLTQQQPM